MAFFSLTSRLFLEEQREVPIKIELDGWNYVTEVDLQKVSEDHMFQMAKVMYSDYPTCYT